ncbi:MAG TPA: hypothetical protein VIL16_22265 [Trebonia sp.]
MHSRRNPHRARRKVPDFPARLTVAAVAALATVSFLAMAAPAGASTASPSTVSPSTAMASAQVKQTATKPADRVQPTTPSDVPYTLPVQLPSTASSPTVAADAPYTPAVLNLIAQLEPSSTPTEAELANASILFHGGTNTTCNNVGPTAAPTGTTPSIMPPCWTDAQGVNTFSGPNAEATTGPTTLMNLASSFDTQLANVWGETEGTEARELMVTGLFGPQTDIGDAFTAALLGAMHRLGDEGKTPRALTARDLAEVLDAAILAAAMTCERHGADPPTATELRARKHRPSCAAARD